MANVKLAVDAVIHQEDARMSGVITNYKSDRGGCTRWGLCARWHPELVARGFFDATKMDEPTSLSLAEDTYAEQYEGALRLDDIKGQGIATALLSFAVNEGCHEAVTLLQKAAVACGAAIGVDGELGPATVDAINAQDDVRLVNLFCQFEENYYKQIVANNPSQQVFLPGWENRAAEIDKLCATSA